MEDDTPSGVNQDLELSTSKRNITRVFRIPRIRHRRAPVAI